MAKQDPNITYAEVVEDGGSVEDSLEMMYSVVVGNGAAAVVITAEGVDGNLHAPTDKSALQSAIRYSSGVPTDITATASFDANGHFVPGVNVSTDHVVVVWAHYAGDGDPLVIRS